MRFDDAVETSNQFKAALTLQKTHFLSPVPQVTHIKAPKTAEDEFIEIQSATGTAVQRWAVRSLTLCKLVRYKHIPVRTGLDS